MVRILAEDDGISADIPLEDYPPNGEIPTEEEQPTWESVFSAPDYAALITARQSRRAKEYTTKVNSVLKALVVASVNNGDLPDAAAILHYGPPFSHAVGQMADKNERTAQIVDLITSPSSPAVMLALTGVALVSQILRNHEKQLAEIPNARKRARAERKARKSTGDRGKPRFTIRVLGRQWPVYFRTPKVANLLSGFRAQTREPEELTFRVFSDTKVQAALEKQGIKLIQRGTPES